MNNFLTRLFSPSRKASNVSFDTMNHDLVRLTFGGSTSTAGKMVNENSAMTLSTVWGCHRVLTETVGGLPWAMYERDAKGNATRVTDHPLADILLSPNRDMTGVEYKEATTMGLCVGGNAYSFREDSSSKRLISLTPIKGRDVTPKRRDNGTVYYSVNDRGKATDVPREKIWHVKGFGDGMIGLSPLSAAREAMGFALATEEFGARFFSQGGKPSGIATIPNFLTADQRKVARENLQQMLGGMSNAHKFALFEGGIKPEPWGDMPLQDMEFLLLRKFNVQEICRFYRVPPHMVADLERATFSNIEHQSQEFVTHTIMPYLTRIEASFSKWLLTPEERAKFFLRFNLDGLLRADTPGRSAFYNSALQNGWMNRNDVRAKENLNRVEDPKMDAYTVQANMLDIADLGKQPPTLPRGVQLP